MHQDFRHLKVQLVLLALTCLQNKAVLTADIFKVALVTGKESKLDAGNEWEL